ncbi:hypothetical protein M3598_08195 [Cytobacillus oceanisediminis]|uniref:hypothetical protein n=1 Tax=Cytobacillus oceanisediminis TaxID=665099 RepID=UPI0020404D9F|nr:hypothetical protein [Cytobacillus oceanisediminis]MCM3242724.1 hypothetical protein [Cytobacillus oceanisediminis]
MDIKTLEYMEERAGKARAIVDRIELLLKRVNSVKKSSGVIDLYTPNRTVRIDPQYREDGHAVNNFETRIAAAIYNTFIDVTLQEIRHLEKELAEL